VTAGETAILYDERSVHRAERKEGNMSKDDNEHLGSSDCSSAWHNENESPTEKGWYLVDAVDGRFEGEHKYRAWGNGSWWVPLAPMELIRNKSNARITEPKGKR
jgi:hypothetical protein